MATHSSILAWTIPWTGEPGSCSSWGHKESDVTERAHVDILRQEKKNLAYLCATPTPTASSYFQAFLHGLEVGDKPYHRVRHSSET